MTNILDWVFFNAIKIRSDKFSIGERAARGEDGKTYYVPSDMTYKDWENAFVDGDKSGLQSGEDSGIISSEDKNEQQRYGRNKATTVNSTVINSGEYKRKFDTITDNPKVNKVLYSKAKEMLQHRSGTLFEDMYWIDPDTGNVVASELNAQDAQRISYSKATIKALKNNPGLIAMHTHPESMPPSIADFNACFQNGYKMGVVACHDGKVFVYKSNEYIDNVIYDAQVIKQINRGYDEYEAQVKALKKLMEDCDIDFKEVSLDGV